MKKVFFFMVGVLFVMGMLTSTLALADTTAAPALKVEKEKAKHEMHPEIHKAIHKLRAAKEDLEKADHDFGGHRVKAIQAIDQALGELKEALASDKK